jgi:quinol monooxygenase YgiN
MSSIEDEFRIRGYVRFVLLVGAALLASAAFGTGGAQEMQDRYVQIAEIEIDRAQLDAYKAAVREHTETAVRVEPGVLALQAVSEKDDPTHIRVFEIYANMEAYKADLQAPHFKKHKAATEMMVRSLRLIPVVPVALSAKTK